MENPVKSVAIATLTLAMLAVVAVLDYRPKGPFPANRIFFYLCCILLSVLAACALARLQPTEAGILGSLYADN